jgi:hypothetical protein
LDIRRCLFLRSFTWSRVKAVVVLSIQSLSMESYRFAALRCTPFSHDADSFVVLYGSVMVTLYWGFVMSSRHHTLCSLM